MLLKFQVVVWDTPRVVIIAAHLLLGSWRILADGTRWIFLGYYCHSWLVHVEMGSNMAEA